MRTSACAGLESALNAREGSEEELWKGLWCKRQEEENWERQDEETCLLLRIVSAQDPIVTFSFSYFALIYPHIPN